MLKWLKYNSFCFNLTYFSYAYFFFKYLQYHFSDFSIASYIFNTKLFDIKVIWYTVILWLILMGAYGLLRGIRGGEEGSSSAGQAQETLISSFRCYPMLSPNFNSGKKNWGTGLCPHPNLRSLKS